MCGRKDNSIPGIIVVKPALSHSIASYIALPKISYQSHFVIEEHQNAIAGTDPKADGFLTCHLAAPFVT